MFYDIEQNTDKWFDLRLGIPTSSNYSKLMANVIKKDKVDVNCAFGDPAKKYARRLAIEIIKGEPVKENYSNFHMERGHEEEPIARALYEEETFTTVTNGGIWVSNGSGGSPDGMVGDDGLIEIKSVIYDVHGARIEKGGYDLTYKYQYQGNMWKSDRLWCDFVQYCSEFPEGGQLYIHRIERDQQMIILLDQRVDLFKNLVQEKVEQYKKFINNEKK